MIATGITSLIGFVFWVVVARVYSSTDIGLASAAISVSTLLALIANLGLGFGLVRFLPHARDNGNKMINSCLSIGSLAAIALSAIFLAGIQLWSPALVFIRDSYLYAIIFTFFTLAFTLNQISDQVFVAARRAGFLLSRNLIYNLLRIPLPLLFASFFKTFGIFTSWTISLVAALLISVFLFIPRVQPEYRPAFTIKKKTINEISQFSLANYLSHLFWTAPGLIFPVIIVNILGTEPNAYFYIAWAIGNLLTSIPGAVGTSLFAEGSYQEDQLWGNVWRGLKMSFLLLVPAVALFLIIGDKILLVFGVSYSEGATDLLRILAASSLPSAINLIYLAIKRVEKKLGIIIGLPLGMMIFSLVVAYVLLPDMGISGAGIAWLGGQTAVAAVITVNWVRKVYRGSNAGQVE